MLKKFKKHVTKYTVTPTTTRKTEELEIKINRLCQCEYPECDILAIVYKMVLLGEMAYKVQLRSPYIIDDNCI